jgi:Tol biopolymer transport system component
MGKYAKVLKVLFLLITIFTLIAAVYSGKSSGLSKGEAAVVEPTSQLLFLGNTDGRPSAPQVFVMNGDGTSLTQVTDLTAQGVEVAQPAWSPDGQKITFVCGGLYVIDSSGENLQELFQAERRSFVEDPAWSPNGEQIIFTFLYHSGRQILRDIWIINADGSDAHPLATADTLPTPDGNQRPVWSPDGTQIAFLATSSYSSDRSDIFVMNADGSNLHNLTNTDTANEISQQWSPDGSRLLYASGYDIWVIEADGSNPHNLTASDFADYDPAWSPDGQHIVWIEEGETWVMGADGSNKTELTDNPVLNSTDLNPRWSPDGQWIVFSHGSSDDHPRDSEIYIIDTTGENRIQLTNNQRWEGYPAWRP